MRCLPWSADDAEKAIRENEEFAIYGNHNDLLPDGSYAGGISKGRCRMALMPAMPYPRPWRTCTLAASVSLP